MTTPTLSLQERVADALGYDTRRAIDTLSAPTNDIPVFGSIIRGQIAMEEVRLSKEHLVPLLVECWLAADDARRKRMLGNTHPHTLYLWRKVAAKAAAGENTRQVEGVPRLMVRNQEHPRFGWLVNETFKALSPLDSGQLGAVFRWNSVLALRWDLQDLTYPVPITRRFGGPFTSQQAAREWVASFEAEGWELLEPAEITDNRDRGFRTRKAGNIRVRVAMVRAGEATILTEQGV